MHFNYSHEKNTELLKQRGLGFNEIIQFIMDGNLMRITNHYNTQDYPNQKIMHVKVLDQIYLVPYIIEENGTIFFKTLFPSRKATKQYWLEMSKQSEK